MTTEYPAGGRHGESGASCQVGGRGGIMERMAAGEPLRRAGPDVRRIYVGGTVDIHTACGYF